MNIFLYAIIFICGTMFGSFYTLAVYRIPKNIDIVIRVYWKLLYVFIKHPAKCKNLAGCSTVKIYVRPQGRLPCNVNFLCCDYLSLSWDFFLCFGWEFCLFSSWSCLSLLRTLCFSCGLCCFSAGFCPFLTACSHSARSWLRFVAPPQMSDFLYIFLNT